MKRKLRLLLCIMFFFCVSAGTAHAGHPLITEDAGTVGKGKYSIEVTGETGIDRSQQPNEDGTASTSKSWESEFKTSLTYGITDTIDVSLAMPYAWGRMETDGETVASEKGVSDISVALKWKFFEKDNYGFALKSEIFFPTGDNEKGLGNGRVSGSLYLMATKEIDPFAFHVNLGYKRNENKNDQREDLWHASLAGEWKVFKKLVLVANVGIEKNPDSASSIDPAFLLGGVIYSITDNIDIDFGVKAGLTYTERDLTWLGGVTFKF